MAKAVFQKGQRVFVKSVGAWAAIERILPQWVRGVEEPIKVLYDVGLGRDFQASELIPEGREDKSSVVSAERWRVARMRNRMSLEANEQRHPVPGTFPVVITDDIDWGGWRVPAAEYERDPSRIEFQALLIAAAPRMLAALRALAAYAEREGEPPPGLEEALRLAQAALSQVYEPVGPSLAAPTP